ncbi:MAG: biphenyl 2,3-dioxygenase, partial [Gammaproteobacteria bacterium]|nr:biphenyl 2,3-dioxygenase [Gammaproteobacteria bacterium]
MSSVKGLGYVGFEVTDIPAWDDLLGTVFGIAPRADSPPGSHQYRIDDNHHRLTLHAAETDRLAYIGWEMETPTQLD